MNVVARYDSWLDSTIKHSSGLNKYKLFALLRESNVKSQRYNFLKSNKSHKSVVHKFWIKVLLTSFESFFK